MVLDHEFPFDVRVEKEARSLINNGYHVVVACFTKINRPLIDSFEGIEIIRTNISELTHKTHVGCLKFPFYFWFWESFLNNILKKDKFDFIHIHDLPLAKVGFRLAKKYSLNYILDLHENWPEHLRTVNYTKSFLGKILSDNEQWDRYEKNQVIIAQRVIVINEFMKSRVQSLSGRIDGIYVVQNFLEFDNKFQNLQNNPSKEKDIDQINLMYVGGIDESRGLEVVISGVEILSDKLKSKKFNLRIIGQGNPSYISTLQKRISNKNLSHLISLEGPVLPHLVLSKLLEADILLLPHIKSKQSDNSSPNKLFQYFSAGKPVVCSNCNSLIPIINEHKAGRIYEHNNPNEFALKVIELIEEDNFDSYNMNKVTVQNNFNWSISEQGLLKCYHDFNENNFKNG